MDEPKIHCSTCDNHDICRFVEQYREELAKIKASKHPLFIHTLECKKYREPMRLYGQENKE